MNFDIFQNVFRRIKKLYKTEARGFIPPVNAWDIHKVIRMSFGFNGKAITPERMKSKADIVEQYEFKE